MLQQHEGLPYIKASVPVEPTHIPDSPHRSRSPLTPILSSTYSDPSFSSIMDDIDIKMLERVVGDISHTGPALTGLIAFISKHVDKKTMTVMLQSGEHQLHLAGTILDHKHVRQLLGSNHDQLTNNYALSVVFCTSAYCHYH